MTFAGRPAASPPTSPRSSPGPTTGSTGPCTPAAATVPLALLLPRRRWPSTSTPTRIFAVTRHGLRLLPRRSSRYPYPFGKYDQVFVPEYNLGAMENPGWSPSPRTTCSAAGPPARPTRPAANTILHEMAHMWFGDLVTMRWWDDLWLKESFADLMGSLRRQPRSPPSRRAWTTFANAPQGVGVPAGPAAHHPPDRRRHGRPRGGASRTSTASPTPRAPRCSSSWWPTSGRRSSSPAAATYFPRHAYGNTSLADLLGRLRAASGRDLHGLVARSGWRPPASPSSTPCVETELDGRITRLAVTQTATAPVTAHPTRARTGSPSACTTGRRRAAARPADRDRRRRGADRDPGAGRRTPQDLLLVNDDDLSYAKVRLDPARWPPVREHLATIPASLSRALVWSALWNATRDAELPASEYLDVAFRQAGREPAADLLDTVLGEVATAIENYLPAAAATRRALTPRGDLPRRTPRRGARVGHPAHLGPAPDARRDRQCGRHRHGARPARRRRAARGAHGRRRPALGLLGGAGRTGCGDRPPSSTRRWPRTTR